MRVRILPAAVLATIVVAFAGLIAACGGGGDDLTLEEYFEQLEEIAQQFQDDGDDADDDFEDALSEADDEDEAVEAYRDFLGGMMAQQAFLPSYGAASRDEVTSYFVVDWLISGFLTTIGAVVAGVGYYCLRSQKEGTEIDQIAAVFD